MPRLINADALLAECKEAQKSDPNADGRGWANHFLNAAGEPSAEWYCVEDMIENAPTIDAEPVVHATWIPKDTDGSWRVDTCSACKKDTHYVRYAPAYDFCPNCGAKMDGGERDAVD